MPEQRPIRSARGYKSQSPRVSTHRCSSALRRELAMDSGDDIQIERQVVITSGKKPWIVERLDVVGGVEFIQLAQSDRNFIMFVVGKIKNVHFNWAGLCAIRRLRQEASVEAVAPSDSMFDNEHVRKRAKIQARLKQDELPPFVVMTLPAIEDKPAIDVKVITSLDLSTVLSVELKVSVLSHIRAMCLAGNVNSEDKVNMRSPVPAKVLRWHSQKAAYIAVRSGKARTFRPEDCSSPSKAAAKSKAMDWIEFGQDVGVLQDAGAAMNGGA